MSGKIINIKKLEDTALWRHLQSLDDNHIKSFVGNLSVICEEAADRMKSMPTTSPQYTLHDETHFLRVTELMAMILGDSLKELNVVELSLLILTAYFHDQGMVMDAAEYQRLSEDADFQLFAETWSIEHPNKKEIQSQLQDQNINEKERTRLVKLLVELDAAMLTDYLRTTHAKRSSDWILQTYSSDKRLEVSGINLSMILAKLCASHCSDINELIPANGFNHDEQIGLYSINLPFLAIILRLADILDFDADRTPDVLFRTIHFSSKISLNEWGKHRDIKGWKIGQEMIRFTAGYSHPAYQSAALQFMDWIDKELNGCHSLCRIFPAEFSQYKLQLPLNVDRSRITPLDNSYIYHDLEIGLSRNEIIKLLMTDKLYSNPHLCIRELLQNSLDALRYRKALFGCAETEWNKGKVEFLHSVDKDGYEVIQCKDNGAGMDRDIITRFFTKAGRSFYRSPEFERERMRFRKKDIDYDPCSQFGIGFMSCFMLGDRIKIETRRDYGSGKAYGDPLVVEINGLGGLVIIRKGSPTQKIGTTVSITSRKKPSFVDKWTDMVLLTTVLKAFAVATEFPITGRCDIEELKDSVEIPVTPSYLPTLMEDAGLDTALFITLEQDFNELDKNLKGTIRESFLINKKGLPTLKNQHAFWKAESQGKNRKTFSLRYKGEEHDVFSFRFGDSQISIDGIHLCGIKGRPAWQKDPSMRLRLGERPTRIDVNPYALDVRGNLKPEISPAREPIDYVGRWGAGVPKWKELRGLIEQSAGKIWAQLFNEFVPKGLPPEIVWKLLPVHNGDLTSIPLPCLWHHVSVPCMREKETGWIKFADLRELSLQKIGEESFFITPKDQVITLHSSVKEWEGKGLEHPYLQHQLNSLIAVSSKLSLTNGTIKFIVSPLDNEHTTSASRIITGAMTLPTLPYIEEASNALTVKSSIFTANSTHPLVKQCFSSNQDDPLVKFASSFIPCIVDIVCSEKKERTLEKPDRRLKICAHYYFQVDWTKFQDKQLKAPYKIWLDTDKPVEITESDLADWRDS
ncbi:MAG: hypothetical protein D3914_06070 [Candidatus Electrothrix sp. LOE2]|nr:hypothetical protein [Candidatus Electrothrix sp. LOE2]